MATAGPTHYAICVRNDEHPASLEVRKLYAVVPDAEAEEHGLVRIVDESGEDYLYPGDWFIQVELPPAVVAAFAVVA
jgi:hypothetical protein